MAQERLVMSYANVRPAKLSAAQRRLIVTVCCFAATLTAFGFIRLFGPPHPEMEYFPKVLKLVVLPAAVSAIILSGAALAVSEVWKHRHGSAR